MKHLIILSFAALTLLPACSKDSDPTAAEQLTDGRWTNGREFEDPDLDGQFAEIPPETCNLDDGFTFRTDQTLLLDYGTLHCDPDDPAEDQTLTLSWRLEDNDRTLVMEFPLDEIKFNIVSIKQNELVLAEIDAGNPGVYTDRFVLTR